MHLSVVMIIFLVLLLLAIISCWMALASGEQYIRILFLYLIAELLITMLSVGAIKIFGLTNNLFLFHIFTPIEYSLVTLIYFSILSGKLLRKIVGFSIPFFIALSIFFSLYIQKIPENNSFITIIESTLIICWTMVFLREVLLLKKVTVLYTYPLFWISAGILVYFTESLVIEGLLTYMIKYSLDLARQVYRIGFIFRYILFLSLAIGTYFQYKLAKNGK